MDRANALDCRKSNFQMNRMFEQAGLLHIRDFPFTRYLKIKTNNIKIFMMQFSFYLATEGQREKR